MTEPATVGVLEQPPTEARALGRGTTILFASAAFIGAGLLFVVQPLVARLVLPSYGGSSTVWSTSSLFFQVLLLVGYAYTHASTSRAGRTWQPRLHVLVLLIPLVVLPVALPADAVPSAASSPVLWLLRTLTLMIGLPFLVLATTGPLLQKWYSWTDQERSDDPYFLFAASNLGSFIGLLAYPFVVEPLLSLDDQQRWWSIAFVGYVVLVACCGLVAARSTARSPKDVAESAGPARQVAPVTRGQAVRWLILAFLPSALLLAVTSHVTTDVAPVPMLWVVPLALYLATFVVAFALTSRTLSSRLTRVVIAVAFVAATSSALPGDEITVLPEIIVQMLMLTGVCFVAHSRLAADRPDPEHLTTYYMVIAAGGALGGLLNGLLAPVLFDRVLEYPLVMIAIPMLVLGMTLDQSSWLDRLATRPVLWAVVLLGLTGLSLALTARNVLAGHDLSLLAWASILLLVGILAFRMVDQPRLLCLVLVVLFGAPIAVQQTQTLDQSRTFFGSYRVLERGGQNVLIHGTTVHGTQFLDERSTEPTTYYAESGPLGSVFAQDGISDVGVVGLGVGTVGTYGEPGMDMTFFEIDPEVVRIAESERLFTYLSDSAADVDVVVGDGRLKVDEQPDEKFDLLILDAFSSDAVPVHLLTTEAMRTYASKLAPDGMMAVHISSRVFNLQPVIAGAAQDLGWPVAAKNGGEGEGASLSEWVVLSPSPERVDDLVGNDDWRPLTGHVVTWTDDFSSTLSVLK